MWLSSNAKTLILNYAFKIPVSIYLRNWSKNEIIPG